jgi:hypothetical protein
MIHHALLEAGERGVEQRGIVGVAGEVAGLADEIDERLGEPYGVGDGSALRASAPTSTASTPAGTVK